MGRRIALASSSLDAVTLAGAKMLADDNNSDTEVRDAAKKYFDSSIATAGITLQNIDTLDVAIDRTNSTVSATVNATVPTFFGGLAFQPKLAVLTQNSKVTYDMKHIELALVLDVTGSMCDTPPAANQPPCNSGAKLRALKAAAKDMVDALFESNPEVGFVKVSLVPYSASVNAGGYASSVSGGASGDGCVVERSGAQGVVCRDSIRADLRVTFLVRINQTTEDVLKVSQSVGCARASYPAVLHELFAAKFTDAIETVARHMESRAQASLRGHKAYTERIVKAGKEGGLELGAFTSQAPTAVTEGDDLQPVDVVAVTPEAP